MKNKRTKGRPKKSMQVAVIKSKEWFNSFGNVVIGFPLERVR